VIRRQLQENSFSLLNTGLLSDQRSTTNIDFREDDKPILKKASVPEPKTFCCGSGYAPDYFFPLKVSVLITYRTAATFELVFKDK
jgi:hypothetical protein